MSRRRKGRTHAMLSLFSYFVSGTDPEETLKFLEEDRGAGAQVVEFARELMKGVVEHQKDLDELLEGCLVNWSLDRTGNLEKTLLRIGAYELLYHEKTPASAVIHEAIEIAKDYVPEESIRFLNGVLGSVEKKVRPGGS
jgi:transcription antitermination protein NusB